MHQSEADKMKARPQPLNNFSGGEDQIGVNEYTFKYSENVHFDCIMNALFVELKNTHIRGTISQYHGKKIPQHETKKTNTCTKSTTKKH